MNKVLGSISALFSALALAMACGGEDSDSGGNTGNTTRPEKTGAACETVDQCFVGVADGGLQGDAVCLTEVRDGYCTHTCDTDDNCCAVAGECKTDLPQVCSPFESTTDKKCFLSCEPADVAAVPDVADDQEYCQREASRDFICRSSGGGGENRKVCVPGACGVGADCAVDADCGVDLVCVATFKGGYCTVPDCTVNADCPMDSLCVTASDNKNYCFKSC
ncbi:MAG TPA: hypothetical protein VGP93_01240, partial [Polyangiaceae bacterium]|nr:hypothetical protein [Polyangiaceae bacterium]